MRILCSLLLSVATLALMGQSARDYAVELSATWQQSPDKVTLHWRPSATANNYLIFRKTLGSNFWGSVLASAPGTDSTFADTTVVYGEAYEYSVIRYGSGFTGQGYVFTQSERDALHHFGRLVLVIDTTHLAHLQQKIDRWIRDLNGDGWTVHPVYVDPGDGVTQVKTQIQNIYNQYPGEVEAVQLFGHVPVPYSGNIAPDGHTNNHQGAWPADGYYGDMDGIWTDVSVNNTTAGGTRNDNVPGDGKFDPSIFPSEIELMVGRIDFANMPAFSQTEAELLEAYLDKDHLYRTGQIATRARGLIDDNFGGFGGEAFAASAWRNMAVNLGTDSITSGDYRTELNAAPYQWSYGCGGGSYTSAGGIGNTGQLSGDSLQTIFTMLFGSYFGDWDSENNFLRAAVASGTTLCNAWSGRPHWYFHHMAMGYPIGYGTRLTMNNNTLYWASYGGRFVHIGLIGDLTLRQHTLQPPDSLAVAVIDTGGRTDLSWTASAEAEGYYIYRKQDTWGQYERIGEASAVQFTDSCLPDTGTFYYAVRAYKHQSSPAGSYRNLSPSAFDTVQNDAVNHVIADHSFQLSDFEVQFTNHSSNATSFHWDFGDGSSSMDIDPLHDFGAPGTYQVILTATGTCGSDSDTTVILIEPNGISAPTPFTLNVYPNPASNWIIVELDKPCSLRVTNALGQSVMSAAEPHRSYHINTSDWPRGWYFIGTKGEGSAFTKLLLH